MTSNDGYLAARGDAICQPDGRPIRLRGVNLGGILLMENSVTGFGGSESTMREHVRAAIGDDKYELFFEHLVTAMFDEPDAAFLAQLGVNSVRIPVNYRWLEADDAPRQLKDGAFRHLDRIVAACAAHGIHSIIDLHALPGAQNQHWHSDNPTHLAGLWQHRDFQDRSVWLWQRISEHYAGNQAVAGYNLMDEPADPTRAMVGPFYRELVTAIRAIDPQHMLFLDGNTYSTEFEIFTEPFENVVYTLHDYVESGFAAGVPYPGEFGGQYVDADVVSRNFLAGTEFQRRTGTPLYVGEFGPVHDADPDVEKGRVQMLADQLGVYRENGAGWALWTYKAVRRQGVVGLKPDSPYAQRFAGFHAKKDRLGVDSWANSRSGVAEFLDPITRTLDREFPDYRPYPRGKKDWIDTLVPHLLLADPMSAEYAQLLRGLSDRDLIELAESFAFANCDRRENFIELMRADGLAENG